MIFARTTIPYHAETLCWHPAMPPRTQIIPAPGLISSESHAHHMLIDSLHSTPPCGNNYFFLLEALGNTFTGIDVSLLTCAESMLQILDPATKIWRRNTVEIDEPLGVVLRYRPNLDRRDTPQQRYVVSKLDTLASNSIQQTQRTSNQRLEEQYPHATQDGNRDKAIARWSPAIYCLWACNSSTTHYDLRRIARLPCRSPRRPHCCNLASTKQEDLVATTERPKH